MRLRLLSTGACAAVLLCVPSFDPYHASAPRLDRPDNLSIYTVKVSASKSVCPVLLSNGDCKEKGDLPDGRHYAGEIVFRFFLSRFLLK